MKEWVDVNDRMQRAYRYTRVAAMRKGLDPAFKPELTPAEMLALGVFCGKYMTDCRDEFPKGWFENAKLSPQKPDCSLNHFGVKAGKPLSSGKARVGFTPTTRAAGSSGIAAISRAGRWKMTRARLPGGGLSPATRRKFAGIASPANRSAARGSARRCCNGLMTAG